MEARVTLRPGAKGAKKLTAEFGDRLICVRYRYDQERRRRIKTVEIIVDEADWTPVAARNAAAPEPDREHLRQIVGVRVAYAEVALRRAVGEAGGRWDPSARLWLLPLAAARALGLQERIIQLLPDNRRKQSEAAGGGNRAEKGAVQ